MFDSVDRVDLIPAPLPRFSLVCYSLRLPIRSWLRPPADVWLDAPIGYPSITANYTDRWEEWWRSPEDVELYQFMGKDNVYFHTVLFPAVQMADGRKWTMLHNISATQYLNYENGKFSKSRNVGVFGTSARETSTAASVWRYYLLMNRPETSDSMFTWNEFIARNNGELLNNLGNFVNRVLKFVVAKYQSTVPETTTGGGAGGADDDAAFVKDIDALLTEYRTSMDDTKFRAGLTAAMAISARGNQYLQDNTLDNTLLTNSPERCAQVIAHAVNLIYLLSVVFHPFMPATTDDILKQLNAPARALPERFSLDILGGHTIGKPGHLFKRIEPEMEHVWRGRFGGGSTFAPDTSAAAASAAQQNGSAAGPAAAAAPSKSALAKLKKQQEKEAAAALAAARERLKTPEMKVLEDKIAVQGAKVKELKTGKAEGDVDAEIADLLKLKMELNGLVKEAQEKEKK